jgi:nicotinamidase-related amidase
MSYDPATTAILLVDPYNDFLSDGGKLWPRVKEVADEVGLLGHLREVISSRRARGLKILFVPHHRCSAVPMKSSNKAYQCWGAGVRTWNLTDVGVSRMSALRQNRTFLKCGF